MAEKRMFAKSIVLSDAFLDMPMSARCLYFTLSMLADDDGFVGSPRAIMRQCGASQDDLAILLQKRYLLGFDSGVIVIKHWRINNFLRKDRHIATTYIEELAQLSMDAKGAYIEAQNKPVDQRLTIGQPSIDKYSNRLVIEETDVSSICAEQQVAAAPAVANLPLLDGTEYGVTQEEMDEWVSLYPAVDVPQEFRAMRGWLNGNPKNRKTPKGIKRFINGWLAREQNRARPPGGGIANDGHERNSRGGAGRDSSPSRKYNIQGRDLG